MIQQDKDYLLKTLVDCTAALNEEVTTGQAAVYVTVDRQRYNELLRKIAEAKKVLIRPTP